MPVIVVRIRHMRMGMSPRLVPVRMAVLPCRRPIMMMVMMPIVVAVRMLVLKRRVLVLVVMRLRQVDDHATDHQ